MSDDRSKSYNLRSKRVTAGGATEGFIRASELLRRQDEERVSGDIHRADTCAAEEAQKQELVLDIPPNNDDEGGSVASIDNQPSTDEIGDQGDIDSSREAQRQQQSPSHSPVAEQAAEHYESRVLRLRVQVRNTKTHKVEYKWIPINMLI